MEGLTYQKPGLATRIGMGGPNNLMSSYFASVGDSDGAGSGDGY